MRPVGFVLLLFEPLIVSGCQYGIPNEGQPQGCYNWDFASLASLAKTYSLNTSSCPKDCNLFYIASPCTLASTANCKPGLGSDHPAPAFQVGNQDHSCYSLGSAAHAPSFGLLDAGNASNGLSLTFTGGDSGRSFVLKMVCDPTADPSVGPDAGVGIVEGPSLVYTATW
jgi:hypothetical protein